MYVCLQTLETSPNLPFLSSQVKARDPLVKWKCFYMFCPNFFTPNPQGNFNRFEEPIFQIETIFNQCMCLCQVMFDLDQKYVHFPSAPNTVFRYPIQTTCRRDWNRRGLVDFYGKSSIDHKDIIHGCYGSKICVHSHGSVMNTSWLMVLNNYNQ